MNDTTEPSQSYHILVVDDEPDVFEITKLGLKGFKHNEQNVELHFAASGKEAIEIIRSMPDMAVVLLDVVMETSSAGLDACNVIRNELNNKLVRILLRTGQPGAAPEKKTIDEYDIDAYLPKSELTSTRLYSSIRTAIRAWDQLVQLERHERYLSEINNYALKLRTFESIETTLDSILKAAVAICPTSIGVFKLDTFLESGNFSTFKLYISTDTDTSRAQSTCDEIIKKINKYKDADTIRFPTMMEDGYYLPISLHGELGYGWIFLSHVKPDNLVAGALTLLAAHAENALYAVIARELLKKQRQEPFFNTVDV